MIKAKEGSRGTLILDKPMSSNIFKHSHCWTVKCLCHRWALASLSSVSALQLGMMQAWTLMFVTTARQHSVFLVHTHQLSMPKTSKNHLLIFNVWLTNKDPQLLQHALQLLSMQVPAKPVCPQRETVPWTPGQGWHVFEGIFYCKRCKNGLHIVLRTNLFEIVGYDSTSVSLLQQVSKISRMMWNARTLAVIEEVTTTKQYGKVMSTVTRCYKMLQDVTRCYKMLQDSDCCQCCSPTSSARYPSFSCSLGWPRSSSRRCRTVFGTWKYCKNHEGIGRHRLKHWKIKAEKCWALLDPHPRRLMKAGVKSLPWPSHKTRSVCAGNKNKGQIKVNTPTEWACVCNVYRYQYYSILYIIKYRLIHNYTIYIYIYLHI